MTAYAYDKLDQITSVTDPMGGVTRYSYDANTGVPNTPANSNPSLPAANTANNIGNINAPIRYLNTLPATVWNQNWSSRGFDIEEEIKRVFYTNSAWNHLVKNYPVIDVWNLSTATAVSIKSIDLSLASYQVASVLSPRLNRYVRALKKFQSQQ